MVVEAILFFSISSLAILFLFGKGRWNYFLNYCIDVFFFFCWKLLHALYSAGSAIHANYEGISASFRRESFPQRIKVPKHMALFLTNPTRGAEDTAGVAAIIRLAARLSFDQLLLGVVWSHITMCTNTSQSYRSLICTLDLTDGLYPSGQT
jgi:hypothetical protein